MLDMLCAIPEEIGWALVGMLGTLCGIGLYQLLKIFVQMWKERHENTEECEE